MNEKRLRQQLTTLPLPGEAEAGERGWQLVAAAYAERDPARVRRSRLPLRLAVAVAALALLGASVLSPPGQAVLDSVREAIGVEHAQPALFSLPTAGRLLAASAEGGAWVVQADGSKRRLGDYREASWSPLGRFVVASRSNELAALTPNGQVRWTLARPEVRFPRWAGSATDTRIAYLTGSRLHVVAGDGSGDLDAGGLPAAAPIAPAWQPAAAGRELTLAYADTRGRVHAYSPDSGSLQFRTPSGSIPSKLEWSSDGRRLLVLSPQALRVYDLTGRLVERDDPPDGARNVDATFIPGGHELAVVRAHGAQTDVIALRSGRLLFRTTGALSQVVASPNGHWLLLAWPTADQWVFLRIQGSRRIGAASNIGSQLNGFPTLEGWCCPSG